MFLHDRFDRHLGARVGLVNYSDRYLGADSAGVKGRIEAITKPSRMMTVYHIRCEQTARLVEAEEKNMRWLGR
ncbi:hypothetical protein [Pseudomonas phage LKD16]|uniref:Uncharacterized protein n=1 Tax=Pseudomonas phage LKD16 TaxID=386792 RepID=Q0E660_9CAUD|nr:hypothetical protein PPLKD16_gp05 [Pseudomonas phage LKD16]CAK25939.1 hypothetical protein [Pseudomonas phage LKD16]